MAALLYDKGTDYNVKKAFHQKIIRKLTAAFYSLYFKFDGLHEEIIKFCNSPNIKKLSMVISSKEGGADSECSLRETFADLGASHLSFEEEKELINADLVWRKKEKVKGFAEKMSSINPAHKKRGRKAKATEAPINRPKRQSYPPKRYECENIAFISQSSSSSKRARFSEPISHTFLLPATNEETPDQASFVSSSAAPFAATITLTAAATSAATSSESSADSTVLNPRIESTANEEQKSSAEENGSDSEDGSESEESSLEIVCSSEGLSRLCKSMPKWLPIINTAVAARKNNPFCTGDEAVMCAVLQEVNHSTDNLSYLPGTGNCSCCGKRASEGFFIRKCNCKKCSSLNFCIDHMEHCIKFKHNVLAGNDLHNG